MTRRGFFGRLVGAAVGLVIRPALPSPALPGLVGDWLGAWPPTVTISTATNTLTPITWIWTVTGTNGWPVELPPNA
jgi:hypothetical protein